MRTGFRILPAPRGAPRFGGRRGARRRGERERHASVAARSAQRPAPTEERARRRVQPAAIPLDEATYTCECGYVFAARVTTTVACPHCGLAQAW